MFRTTEEPQAQTGHIINATKITTGLRVSLTDYMFIRDKTSEDPAEIDARRIGNIGGVYEPSHDSR